MQCDILKQMSPNIKEAIELRLEMERRATEEAEKVRLARIEEENRRKQGF